MVGKGAYETARESLCKVVGFKRGQSSMRKKVVCLQVGVHAEFYIARVLVVAHWLLFR